MSALIDSTDKKTLNGIPVFPEINTVSFFDAKGDLHLKAESYVRFKRRDTWYLTLCKRTAWIGSNEVNKRWRNILLDQAETLSVFIKDCYHWMMIDKEGVNMTEDKFQGSEEERIKIFLLATECEDKKLFF